MKSKFYSFVKNEAKETELRIEGVIANESWYEDEVSPKMFREELAKHSGDITVRINSPGGDVFAGVSMYNALREHEGQVTVKVESLAASAASFIAMAGDKILMLPGSLMMVHNSSTFAFGNAEDMSQTIEMLKTVDASMVSIYVARTGLSEERVKELLAAETWMTPSDAVELGFADEAIGAKTSLADAMTKIGELTASMQSAVKQPVMAIHAKKPKATTTEEDIKKDETIVVAEVETPEPTKVEPETEVVAEPQEVKADETKEKETEMSEVTPEAKASIPVEGIVAAAPAAPAKAATAPSMKAYLKTNESMEAFARILEDNASASLDDKSGAERVRAAWKSHLEVKMGVTNPEIFLPTPLIQEIEDAFNNGGEIWQRVSKTGMDSFNAAWDTNSDPDAETGRASGYNRSVEDEKREQELTFAERIIRPQFVYKYITLNKEDVKEQRTTGALVRFVLSELPRRIIREIERAIVIGDGRANGSAYKIQAGNPRGFFSIKADAAGAAPQATTFTPVAGKTVYENLRRARAQIKAEGGVILVAKEGLLLDMEFEQNANGGFLFAPGSDLARFIKVDAVVEPDWMEGDTNDAYMFVPSFYRVVGDQSIEAFQNFLLKTNKNEYLQEIWAGGGLTALKSGVAIAPAATS